MIMNFGMNKLNRFMSRGPYIYFMDDTDDPSNKNFLQRIKNIDKDFPGVFCFHVNREKFKEYSIINPSIKIFEVCVIDKNIKIFSEYNPDETKIGSFYEHVKNAEEQRLKINSNKFKVFHQENFAIKPQKPKKSDRNKAKSNVKKLPKKNSRFQKLNHNINNFKSYSIENNNKLKNKLKSSVKEIQLNKYKSNVAQINGFSYVKEFKNNAYKEMNSSINYTITKYNDKAILKSSKELEAEISKIYSSKISEHILSVRPTISNFKINPKKAGEKETVFDEQNPEINLSKNRNKTRNLDCNANLQIKSDKIAKSPLLLDTIKFFNNCVKKSK